MIPQKLPPYFILQQKVATALDFNHPVVALESAVITHGLPFPTNIELAQALEQEVTNENCTPATIGIIDGEVHVGMSHQDIEKLANPDIPSRKISRRDFCIAIGMKENGGTTVTGTLIAANLAGIKVFATGGIGGVHRNSIFDISADLQELSRSPLIVVCSGAKSILDLPATLEYLETMGIPVLGYQTEYFPAFYSTSSGLPVNKSVSSPEEIVKIAKAHWDTGFSSSILVTVPPPPEYAIPLSEIEEYIKQATNEAVENNISGFSVTPFLLKRVKELTGGKSLEVNLALLKNNAKTAAMIARELSGNRSHLIV